MTVLGYHNLPSNDYVLGKSLIPNIDIMIQGISDHLLLFYVKAKEMFNMDIGNKYFRVANLEFALIFCPLVYFKLFYRSLKCLVVSA